MVPQSGQLLLMAAEEAINRVYQAVSSLCEMHSHRISNGVVVDFTKILKECTVMEHSGDSNLLSTLSKASVLLDLLDLIGSLEGYSSILSANSALRHDILLFMEQFAEFYYDTTSSKLDIESFQAENYHAQDRPLTSGTIINMEDRQLNAIEYLQQGIVMSCLNAMEVSHYNNPFFSEIELSRVLSLLKSAERHFATNI